MTRRKKILLAGAAAALLVLVGGYVYFRPSVALGTDVSSVALTTLDGERVALSDFRGSWVVVDLWHST